MGHQAFGVFQHSVQRPELLQVLDGSSSRSSMPLVWLNGDILLESLGTIPGRKLGLELA